jgi:two-component system sensor histidine kinase AtoS
VAARACADGRPFVATGLASDRAWRRSRLRRLLPPGTGSLVVLPLSMRGHVHGLLVLAPPSGARACSMADVEWFLPVAEHVSLALEKLLLTRRLEHAALALEKTVRARTRELHEANRALRRSLAEVRQLRRYSEQVIASLASSLVAFDRDGRVRTVNPPARALLQLGNVPVAGLRLADLFGAAFADTLLGKLRQRAMHITRVQAAVVLRTGEEKIVGYSVAPLMLSRGGNGWIMLFRDITDNKRLENDLRRLDRLVSLGEISANVAHELKNPLTVMYANMEWLLEKAPEEFRRRIQITIDHMERMEAIIGRMGILSRDQPLSVRAINACDLVSQMLSFVDKTLREKRIDVDVALPTAPVLIQGDPAQLQQALLNVIMNAAQAIGTDGALTVRLDRRTRGGRRGLEVSIADSGPGIPGHVIGRIFEPFFTTKETGTGLGLAITNQIVRAHHGRIRAENLAGRGARIRLWFPLELQSAS